MDFQKESEKDLYIGELFKTSPKDAFRLLFDTYHLKLCLYAVQLTDSFELAEDIVQDFLVSFWEKKYYLGITGSLRYYLFASVRNLCIRTLQKNKMISMEELTGISMDIPDDVEDTDDAEEQKERLLERLSKLSPQEYEAVKAVIMQSKKYKEAAEELHISVNTLKTYLSRAMKQLRKDFNIMLLLY